jgi:UDP-glucose:(heptosyl)LPS alpha-1,3-glucosyltransferase
MRLAFVHRRYSRRGGVERNVVALAEGLHARGHRVTVITSHVEHEPPPEIELLRVPGGGPAALRYHAFDREVGRILAERDFDLVQGFDLTTHQDVLRVGRGLVPVYRSILRAERSLLERWNDRLSIRRAVMERLEERMLRASGTRRIVAISRLLKDEIVAHYALDPEAIEVIYNGVDLAAHEPDARESRGRAVRTELGIAEHAPMILYVGTGFRRKGVRTLLRSLPGVRARLPEARLVVVGRDRHTARYRRQAAELGVADAVLWPGERHDVERFYAAADALAFPTLYDTFGNVTLEALASGVPALVSARAGSSEVLRETRPEWILADPRDEQELAESLSRILEEAGAEQRSAARGIAERYPLERMVDEYERLYERLLA